MQNLNFIERSMVTKSDHAFLPEGIQIEALKWRSEHEEKIKGKNEIEKKERKGVKKKVVPM